MKTSQQPHGARDGLDSQNRFDLTALFEFSTIVNSTLELKFILGHLLLTLMGKLLSLRGIILLKKADDLFTVENVKGLPEETIGQSLSIKKLPHSITYIEKVDGRRQSWVRYFRSLNIHIMIPLITGGKIVGIAGFGLSPLKKRLSPVEETYGKSLSNIAASAIEKGIIVNELKNVNRRLDRKFHEMTTLFELGKDFNAVLDPDRLVKMLMFSIVGQIGASKHFLCLEQNGVMKPVASRLEQSLSHDVCSSFHTITSGTIVESFHRKSELALKNSLIAVGIQVIVPLLIQGEVKGMMGLGEKIRGERYTQPDLEFLTSLGNLAMISLENARLFQEAIEKQKLEDELLIAKEIQRGLLPKTLPAIPSFDLAAINISSKQVGGDYYDIIPLSGSRFVLAIGDVSGKGTPASLLMANLQATIRALVPLGLSLAELTKRVNDLICENTGSDRFITFFWGILDTESRSMKYVSAGHNPPYVFHTDGSFARLDKGGIILGIMKALVPYQEGETNFREGDVLVLFTDGVSEAMNKKEEEWEEERLEAVVKNCLREPASKIVSEIVDAIRIHSQGVPQSDDITLVVAKAM
jgi:sigma-B regulation protein RsbU (phosphoserine phosphatase)